MKLKEIVPWGRSLEEYGKMFNLTERDLQKRILGCGDGPASFNAELTQRGGSVVSCDPIYAFSGPDIHRRFDECGPNILEQVKKNLNDYVWTHHRSPEALFEHRKNVLRTFLEDYAAGLDAGRYVAGSLPNLPFADDQFDLALCSHLLFLYSDLLQFDFHLGSILELCRVASEVRIFPLTDLRCEISGHLGTIGDDLAAAGCQWKIVKAEYQLQRNGDSYLKIERGPQLPEARDR